MFFFSYLCTKPPIGTYTVSKRTATAFYKLRHKDERRNDDRYQNPQYQRKQEYQHLQHGEQDFYDDQKDKDAGVPLSTLQNLYRGHTNSPTVSLMFKIVNALGVDIAEFFSSPLFSADTLELE